MGSSIAARTGATSSGWVYRLANTHLLVGSRGAGGFEAMTLGSVGRYLATRSPIPVVVARAETVATHREIVVGIRDPEESAATLEFTFAEAALRGARLLVVHAWLGGRPA